ncbi:MAG: WbqC family protein [Deltaproteobacteria bacterium]
MILSANQPYFVPFAGFFHKARMSDLFVILDDVQFPQGTTWITRNRFKNHQGALWITVPVWKKGLGLQKISDVRVCHEGRWAKKHIESLKTAYKRAPYLPEHLEFLEAMFSDKHEKLLDLNLAVIHHLMRALAIKTKLVLLSDLAITSTGNRRLVDLCIRMGASRFLAQTPAKKFIDERPFNDAGIEISYVTPPVPVYPQLWGDFIANLSVLDLVLNCGPKAIDILVTP